MQTWQILAIIVLVVLALVGLGILGDRQARAKGHAPRGVLSSRRAITERKRSLKASRRVGGSQAVVRSWVRTESTQKRQND